MTEAEEVAAIPLLEERLEIGKKQVESGQVRVRVAVDTREEIVPADLTHDEVEIRRVPRNVPVAELPVVRLEGDTTKCSSRRYSAAPDRGRRRTAGARRGGGPRGRRRRTRPLRPAKAGDCRGARRREPKRVGKH